ncbi:nickel-binding protein [Chroococcidiopsis cubana]|nr:nickel-binding protein [Chroococcidiopsis cubana]
MRSYLSLDRTRVICELNAPDTQSIREAQHQAGVSFDRVWSATIAKP